MAIVTGLTAARMLAIEAASVVDGDVNAGGHLILTKHDGTTIDAGDVRGPQGLPGPEGPSATQTSAATPNTIAKRDASGRVQVADPATAADVATKNYVDNGLGPKATTAYVDGLVKAKDLGNAVDLNTIITPGVYVQGVNSQAGSGTNYPKPIAGLLEVIGGAPSSTMLWQRYTLYSSYQGAKYERSFYNGAWSAWTMTGKGNTTVTISTYTNSFTWANTSADNPVVVQRNGITMFNGRLKQTAGFTGGAAFTLPTGFRPAQAVNSIPIGAFNGGSAPGPSLVMSVATTGVVTIGKADNATTPAWGSTTWMNLQCTYLAEENY